MSLLLGGLGGGLMCRIKTPQQDYALKMQGGGHICGTLRFIFGGIGNIMYFFTAILRSSTVATA